jgi:hypothetical protein
MTLKREEYTMKTKETLSFSLETTKKNNNPSVASPNGPSPRTDAIRHLLDFIGVVQKEKKIIKIIKNNKKS